MNRKEKKVLKSLLAVILTCVCIINANALEIKRYVNQGGTGRGTSWADACGSINLALNDIKTAGSGTVYVGPGYYTETVYIPNESNDVNIKGGYSENNMENQKKNEMTISGSIEVGWNCKNIEISCVNVRKGNIGIILRGTNILVKYCTVAGCRIGIASDSFIKNHRIVDCTVIGCSETGMRLSRTDVWNSSITGNGQGLNLDGCYVAYCQIYGNSHVSKVKGMGGDGGGVQMSQTHLIRCVIFNNRCDGVGGGVRVTGGALSTNFIFQCLIFNNTALDGGGVYLEEQAYLESSTIVNNKAVRFGGGICTGKYGRDGSEMIGCILWNNIANGVAQQYGIYDNKKFIVTRSAIQGGMLPETDTQNGIIDLSSKNIDASKPQVAFKDVLTYAGAATTTEQLERIRKQDFHLTAQSACIDKGGDFSNLKHRDFDRPLLVADRDIDWDLQPRTDGKYDIGAAEYQK